MKNKILAIVMLLLLSAFSINAQAQTVTGLSGMQTRKVDSVSKYIVDNANYRAYYLMEFAQDPEFVNFKTEAQTVLLIGSKYSAFLDNNGLRMDYLMDSLNRAGAYDNELFTVILPIMRLMKFKPTIIKNHPQKGEYLFQQAIIVRDEFRYRDKDIKLNWEFLGGEKEIMGYKCKEAACNYRGRDYIAWYAPELAISEGPYVFNGLPGLIFEISDSENHYMFRLNGFSPAEGYDPIYYKTENVVESTRDYVRKAIYNLAMNPDGALKSLSGKMKVSEESMAKFNQPKPYNPIELE